MRWERQCGHTEEPKQPRTLAEQSAALMLEGPVLMYDIALVYTLSVTLLPERTRPRPGAPRGAELLCPGRCQWARIGQLRGHLECTIFLKQANR